MTYLRCFIPRLCFQKESTSTVEPTKHPPPHREKLAAFKICLFVLVFSIIYATVLIKDPMPHVNDPGKPAPGISYNRAALDFNHLDAASYQSPVVPRRPLEPLVYGTCCLIVLSCALNSSFTDASSSLVPTHRRVTTSYLAASLHHLTRPLHHYKSRPGSITSLLHSLALLSRWLLVLLHPCSSSLLRRLAASLPPLAVLPFRNLTLPSQ
jgi:hypothetical protein